MVEAEAKATLESQVALAEFMVIILAEVMVTILAEVMAAVLARVEVVITAEVATEAKAMAKYLINHLIALLDCLSLVIDLPSFLILTLLAYLHLLDVLCLLFLYQLFLY